MMNDFAVIIPARIASSRLPKKVLKSLGGKSVLQRVFEQAKKSFASEIFITSADDEVAIEAKKIGADFIKTSHQPNSGTERIIEALNLYKIKSDIIVNVQADEPFLHPDLINQTAAALQKSKADCASLYTPCSQEDLSNDNVVKVVLDCQGFALYFSRSPIPFQRQESEVFKHIGIYAYQKKLLQNYPKPSALEQTESLEQLRLLWWQKSIYLEQAKQKVLTGIDTYEQLQKARKYVG